MIGETLSLFGSAPTTDPHPPSPACAVRGEHRAQGEAWRKDGIRPKAEGAP